MPDSLIKTYNEYLKFREENRPEFIEMSKLWIEAQEVAMEIKERQPVDALSMKWDAYKLDELQQQLGYHYSLFAAITKDKQFQTDGYFDEEKLKEHYIYYTYLAYDYIVENLKVAIEKLLKKCTINDLNENLELFTEKRDTIEKEFQVDGEFSLSKLMQDSKYYSYQSIIYFYERVQYYKENFYTIDRTSTESFNEDYITNWKLYGVNEPITIQKLN